MNVLITGGTRGIGRALVLKFAENKANKIVVFARNQQKLEQLKTECDDKFNNQIITQTIDFSESDIEEQLEKTFHQLNMHFHIVLNNAGLLINKPFKDTTLLDWNQSLSVNLLAPAFIIKNIVKLNKPEETCHVVNITSMGGVQGSVKFPGLSSYSASKAALVNLTECLAEEFKENNITMNSLALGAVQTEMLEEAFPGYKTNVTPTQMADFIHHFSRSYNELINGKVIPVSNSIP